MSIRCHNIEKGFRHRPLFKEVTVHFESGKCHCLLGENGTGKTTLLRMIAGLERLDGGSIQVEGTCTFSGSHPYMLRGTVLENLMYPFTLKQQGRKPSFDRIDELIEQLGLGTLRNQPAAQLSSGERQKVALGRALAWNPDVLLLDEPTSNIDGDMKPMIEALMLEYAQQASHTLLLVSHELAQTQRLSAEIWMLKDQTLQKTTTKTHLLREA